MNKLTLAAGLLAATLSGCAELPWDQRPAPLADQDLWQNASATPSAAVQAKVLTDNDAAFRSKLKLVEGAQQSIDLAYYLYADDYSSSALSQALIEAARRGVAVRLLVDYATNYKRLDLFSMMERLGNEGQGSLQVRFYNRPTRNILQDAVYMTMGCGRTVAAKCSEEKFSAIDKLFADEHIGGISAAERNISNLDIGNSGLFLSGLYGKNADAMALAVQTGQGIDPEKLGKGTSSASPQDRENLKKLGKIYWESKTGTAFQRLAAKGELFFAFQLYGEKLDPVRDTFTSLLPAEKSFSDESLQDWNHFTDFLHHKLLLVDGNKLQMGGRNVEDSYHMRPNPLARKYVFMDTDIYAELNSPETTRAFDALWEFEAMVATLAEVRQHAPNDFVANHEAWREAETECRTEKAAAACIDKAFHRRVKDLDQRIAERREEMARNAKTYLTEYAPAIPVQGAPSFELNRGALLAYVENLPFDKALPAEERRRIHGAQAGAEAKSGKYIHEIWTRALPGLCLAATRDQPKRVILHNAYFFPPANLTYALSRMVKGDHDCSNVTVTVLTNSIETTDLNVVNLAARHALKAFTEFYREQGDPARRAKFEYYEYLPREGEASLSLHSKVSVLGDDIVIGSANADVRSFMMDTNNAMFVRNAPGFVKDYIAFVQTMLGDPQRTARRDDYFAATPRAAMLQEDIATFRELLAKYRADKRLDPEQMKKAEARLVEMLEESYEFTKAAIAADKTAAQRREQQDRFNEAFKPI